jgi:hypothetical protein
MWTINGVGTKLCGKKNIANDSSYQATKWFVVFYMPIIPLKTYRVLELPIYNLGKVENKKLKEFKMLPIRFDITQIIKTFVSYWGGLLAIILILFLLVEYELYFPLLYFFMAIGFVFMAYEIFFKRDK